MGPFADARIEPKCAEVGTNTEVDEPDEPDTLPTPTLIKSCSVRVADERGSTWLPRSD